MQDDMKSFIGICSKFNWSEWRNKDFKSEMNIELDFFTRKISAELISVLLNKPFH